MVKTLYKSDITAFEDERRELTCNGEIPCEQVVRSLAKAVADNVRHDPRSYRAFGPYWWVAKRIMLDNGITAFGTYIDLEWHNLCAYENDFDSAFAAWMYYAQSLENGHMYRREHVVYLEPSRSGYKCSARVYRLVDREVETLPKA